MKIVLRKSALSSIGTFLASLALLPAAQIDWQPSVDMYQGATNTDFIFTTGTQVLAVNPSDPDNGTITLNGVSFLRADLPALQSGVTANGVTLTMGPDSDGDDISGLAGPGTFGDGSFSGNTDLANVIGGATYGHATLTFSGLTVGSSYAIQVLANDARSSRHDGYKMNFSDGTTDVPTSIVNGTSGQADLNNSDSAGGGEESGDSIIGSFIADSSTQSFEIEGRLDGNINAGRAQINAIQIREIPPIIEAENFTAMSGVVIEPDKGATTDSIGFLTHGDWAEYLVNVPAPGSYRFIFSAASNSAGGQVEIASNGTTIGSATIPRTNGWDNWQPFSGDVTFTASGSQTIRLNFVSATNTASLFNLDSFSFETIERELLTIGSTQKQKMRYGMDYERLWYWTGGLNSSERDQVARWSVVDADVDFIRVAVNGGYELTEGTYNLSAYTNKIIPMMQEMQQANPNIKFFASPRPLDEAADNVAWQPYPQWVTGSTGSNSNHDFDWENCAEYLIRYLLLMKSYGFEISFLDITNEWQSNGSGGRVTQDDMDNIHNYLHVTYFANPWNYSGVDSTLFLVPSDIPEIIAPSSWNYSQGRSWIANLDSGDREAISIAASHNTDRTGDAASFAETARDELGDDVEIWNTELHGWKSTSSENETTSFYYYLEAIRAGFGGINGWLAIGTRNQGHSYILNPSGTPTRNVKYHIFQKMASTANYGHALDILDEPVDLLINSSTDDDNIPRNVAAFIKGNLMTVWVINENSTPVPLKISTAGQTIGETTVRRTRWTDPDDVEGFVTYENITSDTTFNSSIPGESVCCFEIVLGTEDFATAQIEAEDFSHQWGTSLETGNDGTTTEQNMANISDGDFSRYGGVALAENSTVSFRVARPSGRPNGSIVVREGSADGPILGQIAVPVTGNWQVYETVETQLINDAGIYNLYLEFEEDGTTGNAFTNFNWFSVNDVNASPVTGLTATATGTSQINLAWDANNGADSYKLKRSTTSNGLFTTIAIGLTGTSYSDTGLASAQQYYYIISAIQTGTEGPGSSTASASTTLAAPTNLVATTAGGNTINLTWNASPGATTYRIRRSTTSGGSFTPIGVSGTTSYSNTGLTVGTTYYYAVEGINSSGLSLPSAEASAILIQAITPQNLIVSDPTTTNVDQPIGTLSFTIAQSGNGLIHQVQWSDTLEDDSWTDLGAPLTGTGGALDLDVAFPTALSKRFYRVKVSLP